MTISHHFLAGRLIDGSGGPIHRDVLLTIEDGIFSAIEPFDRTRVLDQPLTDLSFATLCPPFVDCHVHLAFSGCIDPQERKRQARPPTAKSGRSSPGTSTICSDTVSWLCGMPATGRALSGAICTILPPAGRNR